MVRRLLLQLLSLAATFAMAASVSAQQKTWNIGFLEAGPYPADAELRRHFSEQLSLLLPDGYKALTVPQGFKSGDWTRETCRALATELKADTSIHLVVAIGPWSVEELIAVGYKRPIVAMYRLDPVGEGLVDQALRPIVPNLTVRIQPSKFKADMQLLSSMVSVKRLGLVSFQSTEERARLQAELNRYGQQMGFEVITAEGYDSKGTFAYFKAYQELRGKVDAVYLAPLWACDAEKIRQFYLMLGREKVPSLSWENEYQASRGCLAAGSGESFRVAAMPHAWKAAQIIQGALPADLTVIADEQPGVAINEETAVRLGVAIPEDLRLIATIIEAPESDEVERLGLPEAVGLALAQNPDLQARRAALQAAIQVAGTARSAYRPQVIARASVHRVDPVDGMDFSEVGSFDHLQAGLYLEQTLLSLPTLREIQLESERAAQDQRVLDQAALDLEYAVSVAYLEYQRAWQAQAVAAAYRRETNEALQIARVHRAQDRGRPGEHLRMEEELLLALQAEVQAATDLVCAQTVLNTLMGRPGETRLVAITPEVNTERLIRQMALFSHDRAEEQLVAVAIAGSPKVTAASGEVRRSELQRKWASAAFWPTLTLRGRVAAVDDLSSGSERQIDKNTWSIGLSAELPLFLGGRRFGERKEQTWRLESAEFGQDAAYQQVRGEIQILRHTLIGLAKSLTLVARAVDMAREYLPLVIDGYTGEQRTGQEVRESITSLFAVSREALDLRYRYGVSAARLAVLLGLHPHESAETPDQALGRLLGAAPSSSGR